MKLLAGASTSNITPALGSSMAGGMTDRIATDIHDELQVRSLVLDNERTRLAFALCDLCVLPRAPMARAKHLIHSHTGIPMTNILVAATHTHSAPPAAHLFQSRPDPAYVEWLIPRIADSVRRAAKRLQPARIGWGTGRAEGLVFHRRFRMKPGTIPPDPFGNTTDQVLMNPGVGNPNIAQPAGPVDPEVGLLVLESLDGKPIAALASYALHYVGGEGGGHISADYFGVWARLMEGVGMLANGCSGNINNVDVRGPAVRPAPYARMESVAGDLARDSKRVWRGIRFEPWVELAASEEDLDLEVRFPGPDDVARARKILASAPADGLLKERPHIYARETLILAESWPQRVKAPVQALRIGSLGIATFPGEAFVEMGLEVKANSPFRPTFLMELANDYHGYIPTVEGHQQGGYETWRAKSSYLEKQAAPKMVASALRQLGRLA